VHRFFCPDKPLGSGLHARGRRSTLWAAVPIRRRGPPYTRVAGPPTSRLAAENSPCPARSCRTLLAAPTVIRSRCGLTQASEGGRVERGDAPVDPSSRFQSGGVEQDMTTNPLTEAELRAIRARCDAATPAPWRSYIEGRDHTSASDFIMTGEESARGDDIELSGATKADQDFIAHARQDVPRLLDEIERLRGLLDRRS
jgi:hypothetical protein